MSDAVIRSPKMRDLYSAGRIAEVERFAESTTPAALAFRDFLLIYDTLVLRGLPFIQSARTASQLVLGSPTTPFEPPDQRATPNGRDEF